MEPPDFESTQPSALGDGLTETAQASTPSSYCSSRQPFPRSPTPSCATSCSSTLCLTPQTNQSLSPVDSVLLGQPVFGILKSLSTEISPPPAAADGIKSEELPARASELEFKIANNLIVFPTFPSPHCQPSPGNPPPSLATETATAASSSQSSTQVAVEFAQQLVEALKSINSEQEPSLPPGKPSAGEPKARASRLEFKTVDEVYVSNAAPVHIC
jgi:hypothetical protein